jgi:prepilin-type N-terminal cleavage/methylation domain-containing protein
VLGNVWIKLPTMHCLVALSQGMPRSQDCYASPEYGRTPRRASILEDSVSHRTERGFTLIELMIVLVILGLLTGLAVPHSLRARHTGRKRACVANMRVVDCAKQQWAMENEKTGDMVPGWLDIEPYIAAVGGQPRCPEGNVPYVLNEVNKKTVCTNVAAYPDHVQH